MSCFPSSDNDDELDPIQHNFTIFNGYSYLGDLSTQCKNQLDDIDKTQFAKNEIEENDSIKKLLETMNNFIEANEKDTNDIFTSEVEEPRVNHRKSIQIDPVTFNKSKVIETLLECDLLLNNPSAYFATDKFSLLNSSTCEILLSPHGSNLDKNCIDLINQNSIRYSEDKVTSLLNSYFIALHKVKLHKPSFTYMRAEEDLFTAQFSDMLSLITLLKTLGTSRYSHNDCLQDTSSLPFPSTDVERQFALQHVMYSAFSKWGEYHMNIQFSDIKNELKRLFQQLPLYKTADRLFYDDIISASIFINLLGNKKANAVQLCTQYNFHNLGLLIANNNYKLRHEHLTKQIADWKQTGQWDFIGTWLKRIYTLLAGDFKTLLDLLHPDECSVHDLNLMDLTSIDETCWVLMHTWYSPSGDIITDSTRGLSICSNSDMSLTSSFLQHIASTVKTKEIVCSTNGNHNVDDMSFESPTTVQYHEIQFSLALKDFYSTLKSKINNVMYDEKLEKWYYIVLTWIIDSIYVSFDPSFSPISSLSLHTLILNLSSHLWPLAVLALKSQNIFINDENMSEHQNNQNHVVSKLLETSLPSLISIHSSDPVKTGALLYHSLQVSNTHTIPSSQTLQLLQSTDLVVDHSYSDDDDDTDFSVPLDSDDSVMVASMFTSASKTLVKYAIQEELGLFNKPITTPFGTIIPDVNCDDSLSIVDDAVTLYHSLIEQKKDIIQTLSPLDHYLTKICDIDPCFINIIRATKACSNNKPCTQLIHLVSTHYSNTIDSTHVISEDTKTSIFAHTLAFHMLYNRNFTEYFTLTHTYFLKKDLVRVTIDSPALCSLLALSTDVCVLFQHIRNEAKLLETREIDQNRTFIMINDLESTITQLEEVMVSTPNMLLSLCLESLIATTKSVLNELINIVNELNITPLVATNATIINSIADMPYLNEIALNMNKK